MPIYSYRCAACGHAQDVLQRLSDPVLTLCPACGASAYAKQVTAAGFQLKGSGWYATDFRDGQKPAAKKEGDAADPSAGKEAGDTGSADKGSGDRGAGDKGSGDAGAGDRKTADPAGPKAADKAAGAAASTATPPPAAGS
jgi:putative FmdB family regulatory protein